MESRAQIMKTTYSLLAAALGLSLQLAMTACDSTDKPVDESMTTQPTQHSDEGVDKTARYLGMSPEALAEHLIFSEGNFDLDEPTQEGSTALTRMQQDELQKICSLGRDSLSPDTIGEVVAMSRSATVRPEEGITLGDWQRGEAIALSGYGYRIGQSVDDHNQQEPGGNCYACHQIAPQEQTYGTLGPSLVNFGKLRGDTEATRNYLYDVIYSPHSYFPCTNMPRFGANGVLTQTQIADVMAYLLDPESPVNQ